MDTQGHNPSADCPAGYKQAVVWETLSSYNSTGKNFTCISTTVDVPSTKDTLCGWEQNPTSTFYNRMCNGSHPSTPGCPVGYTRGVLWQTLSSYSYDGSGRAWTCAASNKTITTDEPPPPPAPACNATTNPTTKTTGTSGSQVFSTVGASTFTVPQYNGTLTVEVWGGGGGGSAPAYTAWPIEGYPGGTSGFNGIIIAYGGGHVAGGTASGGTTNLTGGYGESSLPWTGCSGFFHGGSSPNGGAGGASSGAPGGAPGGGGASAGCTWGGGGGGGYSSKTYATGQLSGNVTLTVGAGGLGANKVSPGFGLPPMGSALGGDGAPGAVKFTWTATGQTVSLCRAGYTLKNGTCVSTATCAVCPVGQTLRTISGNRIPATQGSGAPGSQTYATPGTYTFTVPANYSSLNVTVNGSGGGGIALSNDSLDRGGVGGDSSFISVIARGGAGGSNAVACGINGTPGSASGGNVSNATGGGAPGGASTGAPGCPTGGGAGGAGGKGVSTYAPGALPGTVTVQVGTGGSSGRYGGSPGSNGSVTITWTAGSPTCPQGYTLQGSECVAPSTTQCAPDTVCSPGFHFDADLNQCTLDNAFTCAAGTHLDAATNTCIADGVACPAGQVWNGNACVSQCPAGQTWNGNACVCPAGTIWYQNQCRIGLCVPSLECGADGNVYRKDLQCELSFFEECEWGCTDGACNPPPQPKIITWKVSPTLVKKHDTTGVFWNVLNVRGCAVSGSNNDFWASTQGSQVSGRIAARTTYTLHCTPYKGASWTDQTAIVNIIPTFQEQ